MLKVLLKQCGVYRRVTSVKHNNLFDLSTAKRQKQNKVDVIN